MKAITFRVPDEIADWIREKAALETGRLKRNVSVNALVIDLLRREMEKEQQAGTTGLIDYYRELYEKQKGL
ncbi:MAG TPA: hypothetical protein HPP81_13225 [Deltaproteobacteria bacterium]|jgi:hypothetical protein|nr:hypothetical protein [Deltaproteobacteria bacterium]